MQLDKDQILSENNRFQRSHQDYFNFLSDQLDNQDKDVNGILRKLANFQVAIPSWALGAGGTRFGRFGYFGEPASLEQKIEDVGILHALTKTAGAVSLHIPWDIPQDYNAIKELANANDLVFDAVNSNKRRKGKLSFWFFIELECFSTPTGYST